MARTNAKRRQRASERVPGRRDGARNRVARERRQRARADASLELTPAAIAALEAYNAEKKRAAKQGKPTLRPIDEYRRFVPPLL